VHLESCGAVFDPEDLETFDTLGQVAIGPAAVTSEMVTVSPIHSRLPELPSSTSYGPAASSSPAYGDGDILPPEKEGVPDWVLYAGVGLAVVAGGGLLYYGLTKKR